MLLFSWFFFLLVLLLSSAAVGLHVIGTLSHFFMVHIPAPILSLGHWRKIRLSKKESSSQHRWSTSFQLGSGAGMWTTEQMSEFVNKLQQLEVEQTVTKDLLVHSRRACNPSELWTQAELLPGRAPHAEGVQRPGAQSTPSTSSR